MKISNIGIKEIPEFKAKQSVQTEATTAKKQDDVQISAEGKRTAYKANVTKVVADWLDETAYIREMLKRMDEAADKRKNDEFDKYAKCLKIAMRIMNGDKVPIKDVKYLAENQPEMYMKAQLLKRVNPEPKKYKSVLDDDDDKDSRTVLAPESEETTDLGGSAPNTPANL